MDIIDSIIKELENLKRYKEMYENQKKERKVMRDKIYELMMKEYDRLEYKDKVKDFQENTCIICRHNKDCNITLPQDISIPVQLFNSDIPPTRGCLSFEWD